MARHTSSTANDSIGRVADSTNCDREPVHVPGRVRGHGVFSALRVPDPAIVQVSENVAVLPASRPAVDLLDPNFPATEGRVVLHHKEAVVALTASSSSNDVRRSYRVGA